MTIVGSVPGLLKVGLPACSLRCTAPRVIFRVRLMSTPLSAGFPLGQHIDRIADADIRNSAQTVFGIIILGVGPVFAGPFLALLGSVFGENGVVTNFAGMWFTLAAIALITTLLFGLAFRDETQDEIAETETLTGETVRA